MKDTFDRFQEPERGRFGDNEAATARAPRVNGASDLTDLTVFLHAETQKAILVSSDGDNAKAKWLPKSQCEYQRTGKRERSWQGLGCEIVTVTAPGWLAKDKGLI